MSLSEAAHLLRSLPHVTEDDRFARDIKHVSRIIQSSESGLLGAWAKAERVSNMIDDIIVSSMGCQSRLEEISLFIYETCNRRRVFSDQVIAADGPGAIALAHSIKQKPQLKEMSILHLVCVISPKTPTRVVQILGEKLLSESMAWSSEHWLQNGSLFLAATLLRCREFLNYIDDKTVSNVTQAMATDSTGAFEFARLLALRPRGAVMLSHKPECVENIVGYVRRYSERRHPLDVVEVFLLHHNRFVEGRFFSMGIVSALAHRVRDSPEGELAMRLLERFVKEIPDAARIAAIESCVKRAVDVVESTASETRKATARNLIAAFMFHRKEDTTFDLMVLGATDLVPSVSDISDAHIKMLSRYFSSKSNICDLLPVVSTLAKFSADPRVSALLSDMNAADILLSKFSSPKAVRGIQHLMRALVTKARESAEKDFEDARARILAVGHSEMIQVSSGAETFSVKKEALQMESDMFRAMWGGWKESGEGSVVMRGVAPESLGRICDFAAGKPLSDLSRAEARELIADADMLGMHTLRSKCEACLADNIEGVDEALGLLKLSQQTMAPLLRLGSAKYLLDYVAQKRKRDHDDVEKRLTDTLRQLLGSRKAA